MPLLGFPNVSVSTTVVLREDRNALALSLRELVAGRLTNDDFDDDFYEKWCDCNDSAVAEIATFGWTLYSSDVLFPYKLKGRYAVAQDVREMASRAVLFLQTDLEYEWPTNVGVIPYWCLWGPGCYLVLGLALLFVAAFSMGGLVVVLGAIGLLAIIPTLHWLATHQAREKSLRAFHASGDVEAWPFKTQHDFERNSRLG